jgi:hypothetical protein
VSEIIINQPTEAHRRKFMEGLALHEVDPIGILQDVLSTDKWSLDEADKRMIVHEFAKRLHAKCYPVVEEDRGGLDGE